MTPAVCPWCGEDPTLELLDAWLEPVAHDQATLFPEYRLGAFQVATCCETAHEEWTAALNCPVFGADARAELAGLVRDAGIGCRQVYDHPDHGLRIDPGLRVAPIGRREAHAFVDAHHRHHESPAGEVFRLAAYSGPDLVAVATVGRPVSRHLDDGATLEVTRLCVDHGLPSGLTWKACSTLYRAAAAEAGARGFSKIITYTLDTESGMSLRYARWKPVHHTRGGSWDRESRPREDKAPTCPKIRWEKAA